jgi:iron complex transport system substrate-binding protein
VATPATKLIAALALAAVSVAALAADRPGSPARIVSLVPSVTEMLFAIGAGERVVGVGSFDREPPAVRDLARVGGLLDPDLERIFALRPDLVVVYGTQDDLRAQLRSAGIGDFPYTSTDLAGVGRTMRELGARVGAEAGADRAASALERDLAAIAGRVAGRGRPRLLLVFGHEPGSLRNLLAAGGTGFQHDMIGVAGAENVLGGQARASVELTIETVLGLAPEAIVDLHYGGAAETTDPAAPCAVWDRLSSVPAVRDGRVHVLVGDEFVVPGPRIAGATAALARALHPAAFAGAP